MLAHQTLCNTTLILQGRRLRCSQGGGVKISHGSHLKLQDRHNLVIVTYWGYVANPLKQRCQVSDPDDETSQKGRESKVCCGKKHGQILIRHYVAGNDDALDADERDEGLADHGEEDAPRDWDKPAEAVYCQP